MKRSLAQQITIGLGLALALLVANTVVSYRNTLKLIENQRLVTHTQKVLTELESTLSTLKDAETGQRGYLITGEQRYLQPYQAGVSQIYRQVNSLKQLTADNPRQQQRVSAIESAIALKLAELAQSVKLRQEQGFDAAQRVVKSGRGKQIMDNIRASIAEMKDIENQLLQQRSKESQAKLQETLLTFSIATAINLALLALVYFLFRLNHRQSKQEEERLRQNNDRLTLALDAGKMGSWDWNLATNEVLWTTYHEIIFGYEPGKPNRSYKEWADRVHSEDLPKVEAKLQTSIKHAQDFHAEYRVVWVDNSLHWVTAFARFQYDAENRPIRMVGVISDIT
ncbi:MAG: CHASE3 domain-containing protein, partial [Microcoleus sp. T3-bin5]|nr:CHASE3 domain-containing protein [Microcoleus sp. T3-bin5]